MTRPPGAGPAGPRLPSTPGTAICRLGRPAADGRLALGVPLFTPEWKPAGSLMLLEVPDRAGLDDYLAAEPFAAGEVWQRVEAFPFRIAPLPYRRLPQPGAPAQPAPAQQPAPATTDSTQR